MRGIQRLKLRSQQAGMASLLFTMIMMIVISLIVIGFAQLSRRGQRETLDAQLSTQAYYAAETGINDALHAIANGAVYNSADASSCSQFASDNSLSSQETLNSTDKVSYTCLSVNPTPSYLLGNLSANGAAQVFSIDTVDGTNNAVPVNNLTISWYPAAGSTQPFSGCPLSSSNTLPTNGLWTCPFGLLRLDIVPVDGSVTRASLTSGDMGIYVLPSNTNSASTVPYNTSGGAGQAVLAHGGCTAAVCTIQISGLTANKYELRALSLYADVSTLKIAPTNAADGLVDGQTVVDATGKAQDELRRVEVRVPASGDGSTINNYAIETNGPICKLYGTGANLDGNGLQYIATSAPSSGC